MLLGGEQIVVGCDRARGTVNSSHTHSFLCGNHIWCWLKGTKATTFPAETQPTHQPFVRMTKPARKGEKCPFQAPPWGTCRNWVLKIKQMANTTHSIGNFTLLGCWGFSQPTIAAQTEKCPLQRTQDGLVMGFLSARN